MLKHVGKHNDRKIALLWREVPNEGHMCLLVYSDLLPRLVHDEIMKVLESAAGQAAENLADALWRNIMADGRNTLEVLHREGFIKKVATNQVIVTPNAKSHVRLDELNTILNEMKTGEDAVKRMADLDASAGMTGKKRRASEPKEVGVPRDSRSQPAEVPLTESVSDILSDADLAKQRVEQAEKMRANAQQLLAEAERLMAEAAEFNPKLKTKPNAKKKSIQAH